MDRGLDFPRSSQPLCTRTFLHTHACTPCAHCLPSASVLCTHAACSPSFFFFFFPHTCRADQSGRLAPFSSALNHAVFVFALRLLFTSLAPMPRSTNGLTLKQQMRRVTEKRGRKRRREERTSYFVYHNRDILTSLSIAPVWQRLPQKILSGSLSPPPSLTYFFSPLPHLHPLL